MADKQHEANSPWNRKAALLLRWKVSAWSTRSRPQLIFTDSRWIQTRQRYKSSAAPQCGAEAGSRCTPDSSVCCFLQWDLHLSLPALPTLENVLASCHFSWALDSQVFELLHKQETDCYCSSSVLSSTHWNVVVGYCMSFCLLTCF